jgi:hypothetical protein
VFVGMVTGFFVGIILSAAVAKQKENPRFWKATVHKQLEKLHPTPEQRQKFDARTDSAVQELVGIRKGAVKQVWDVVEHAVGDIDEALTPEQRLIFKNLKPKKPAEVK